MKRKYGDYIEDIIDSINKIQKHELPPLRGKFMKVLKYLEDNE